MKRIGSATCLALVLLSLTATVWAYPFKPNEHYRTLVSDHFRVNFPAGYRFLAQKTAVIAERTFAELTTRYHWTPSTPIDIVLYDRIDEANGSSTVSPVQIMRLFMPPPHSDDRLDFYDDWLQLLITHEMTHAVHTDMVRGINRGLRYTFGRIMPLPRLQPLSFLEGNAVLQETEMTTKGRNRSPMTAMYLRMAALADRWPAIDQTSVDPGEWPAGAVPYLWGGLFHQYLYDRYGMEKLAQYQVRHAGQIWPFLYNHNARVVFGTHIDDLYKAWSVNQQEVFRQEAKKLRIDGLTNARRLTQAGFYHADPAWLDDRTLVYTAIDRDRVPSLRRMDVRSEPPRESRIATIYGQRGLDTAPDGTVILADRKPVDRWHTVFDLWRVDPHTGRKHRLTENARLSDPCILPDGRHAVAVFRDKGHTYLVKVDTDTGDWTYLTPPAGPGRFVQFASPALHPSGNWLALSVWHDDGNRDLFKFDLTTHRFTRLTAHPARDIEPAFDSSGRYLVFSSGRSGIYNLYALDLQTDRLLQLTNVLGGTFQPAVSPDGKNIAFVGYTADGYDLFTTDFAPDRALAVTREQIAIDQIVYGPISRRLDEAAAANDDPVVPYRAYRTAWPHYWLPNVSFGGDDFLLGARTAGFDVAGDHAWEATFGWAFDRAFPHAGASYSYSHFTPTFRVAATHRAAKHTDLLREADGDSLDYWERRITGRALVLYPLAWRHSVWTGYLGEWRGNLDDLDEEFSDPPFSGYWSGVQIGWRFSPLDGTPRYPWFPLGLSATFFDKAFGSEIDQQIYGAQAGVYLPLPWRRFAWQVETQGAWSEGDLLPQRAFRLGGFGQHDPLDLNYDRDRFALRGYNTGTAVGDRIATGRASFLFPIWEIDRGFSTWPVFLEEIHGRAYAEAGTAIDAGERIKQERVYPDAGADLYLDTVLAYAFDVRFSAGVAYGFRDRDDNGGLHWLITLGGLLP